MDGTARLFAGGNNPCRWIRRNVKISDVKSLSEMTIVGDWRINKEINIGEIFTVVSLLCVLVGFFVVQDRRIEKNSIVNEQQSEQIDGIVRQIEANRIEQKSDINRLDGKLDDIRNLIIQQGK